MIAEAPNIGHQPSPTPYDGLGGIVFSSLGEIRRALDDLNAGVTRYASPWNGLQVKRERWEKERQTHFVDGIMERLGEEVLYTESFFFPQEGLLHLRETSIGVEKIEEGYLLTVQQRGRIAAPEECLSEYLGKQRVIRSAGLRFTLDSPTDLADLLSEVPHRHKLWHNGHITADEAERLTAYASGWNYHPPHIEIQYGTAFFDLDAALQPTKVLRKGSLITPQGSVVLEFEVSIDGKYPPLKSLHRAKPLLAEQEITEVHAARDQLATWIRKNG